MPAPLQIGKYELGQHLGGGMAHVFRARDTVIGRTVAVKVLRTRHCGDSEARQRFLQEARVAGNLYHDNVVRIYDFGEDETQRPYIVMEFLEGEDLARAIEESRTGDLTRKLSIADDIAAALEYIHAQGIIHRDIKPANIFLTKQGTAKLMDFGICKADTSSLTRTGTRIGTPAYMAPEQIRGETISQRADIYAFGVLLFELVTGLKAYTGDTVERLFYAALHEAPDHTRLQASGTPAPLIDLILRCCAKDPAERPAGFTDVRRELNRIRRCAPDPHTWMDVATATATAVEGPGPVTPVDLVPHEPALVKASVSRRYPLAGLAAAGVIAAIVGIYFYVAPGLRPPGSKQDASSVAKKLPDRVSTSTGAMLLVPEGSFLFGRDKRPVSLDAFYIDETEVTNRAYEQFARATGRPLPGNFEAGRPDYPVSGVRYEDAKAFAAFVDKRLPTSMEWEKAARGIDGRNYPWGNEVRTGAAVAGVPLSPADSYHEFASPFGTVNMVGNLWEFVEGPAEPSRTFQDRLKAAKRNPLGPLDHWVLIRGGSFKEPLDANVMWDSASIPVWYSDKLIGFRCVKSAR